MRLPIAEQERLLGRWREEFPRLPILEVETKADLLKRPGDRPKVSAVTGEGLEDLQRKVRELVRPRGELPPIQEELTEPPEESSPEIERPSSGARSRRRARR